MKQNTEKRNTKSHDYIISLINEKGLGPLHGGIQLFTDQKIDYYSISINYTATGIHIDKNMIDERELIDDELIKICKTWEFTS